MTRPKGVILFVITLALSPLRQGGPEPFQPFQPRAYRLVNGVAFDGDETTMIFALLHREVLAHRGRPDSTVPETGLFTSRHTPDGWSEPELMPFSGRSADYEPALSADGSTLLFNSKRPYPDGRTPMRNDLFIVDRRAGAWGTPRPLTAINSFDLEESYASIDSAQRVVFVRGPVVEGGDDFDLYEFTLRPDGSTSEPSGLPFSGKEFGEGDPQLAHDGSFIIFTRWDHRIGWQQTCDLYLSFRTSAGWTIPVPLTELNTTAPDYAAAISPDGNWLYYRAGGRYQRRPLGPVLDSARARTR
jgi:WD40-like Beta Propeller Repeat